MIVVFVIDTSPSMNQRLVGSKIQGMSRLDLAKMTVESLTKGLNKRISEHNSQLQQLPQAMQQSMHNLGLGYCQQDQFLLLSTSRQYIEQLSTAACGAGGRLLVGFGDYLDQSLDNSGEHNNSNQSVNQGSFEKELKKLKATLWKTEDGVAGAQPQATPFPEDAGGAVGLNAALSHGLALLSRYRLQSRNTENFGMGRLPSPAMLTPNGQGNAVNALQPGCLILITDGECLRKIPAEGGGSLQLKFGDLPLREFYQEPFRWDQRVITLCVGGREGVNTSQYLHSTLRALCEVTGGFHMMLRSTTGLSHVVDSIIKNISPPRPKELPIPDPMRSPSCPPNSIVQEFAPPPGSFVNGGPICCFQSLEAGPNGEISPTHRAMMLYVPFQQPETKATGGNIIHPPIWCLPESFFPGKKLDTLPPRLAQPLLTYSSNFGIIGTNTFDPTFVIKCLNRLDNLLQQNRKANPLPAQPCQYLHQASLLHRDNYICEWVSQDGKPGNHPRTKGMEYFPVVVRGAGRAFVDGEEQMLGIGILYIPQGACSVSQLHGGRVSTLTLLPPEPHILLPLLIKAAEAEARAIKKSTDVKGARNVHLDEGWRNEFRSYMFRIPPYYHAALKRCLRPVLPASSHLLLNTDGSEPLAHQCFSKACAQKIRNGELMSQSNNERVERQEIELRRRGVQSMDSRSSSDGDTGKVVGYGQYDPRVTTGSYLAALRNLPPPWKVGAACKKSKETEKAQETISEVSSSKTLKHEGMQTAADVLGDLPADCLIAYYESRRRWIFGGSGLTTRGVFVDGVNNDGSNVQKIKANHTIDDEPLLVVAQIGVSTLNQTTTAKMGDFRERLLWSRAPIVGSGSGVASTTAADGAPLWSVDDDVLPLTFFDNRTGEFNDTVQARMRTRLTVHFGNPFNDRRGDSLIPEAYTNQCPPLRRRGDHLTGVESPRTPPGSPPHDKFTSDIEGEGEAVFAPIRKAASTPDLEPEGVDKRALEEGPEHAPDEKRMKLESSEGHANAPSPEKKPRPPTSKPAAPPPKPKVGPPQVPPRKPPPPGAPPKPPPPRPPPEKRPTVTAPKLPPPKPAAQPPPPPRAVGPTQQTNPPPPSAQQRPPPPKPTVSVMSGAMATNVEQLPAPVTAISVQSQDNKPDVDLPTGWISAWSKSQKRWYFFDQRTNKSVWEWPPPGDIPP